MNDAIVLEGDALLELRHSLLREGEVSEAPKDFDLASAMELRPPY